MTTATIAENVLTYLGVKNPKQAAQLIEQVQNQVKGKKQNLTPDQSREVYTVLSNFVVG
jgi:hypothetical protein